MKMKSLMMCVMSGMLAATFAYVSPVLADDNASDTQSTSSMANDQNQNGASSDTSATQDNNTNSNDQNGTPDTATGSDDDY